MLKIPELLTEQGYCPKCGRKHFIVNLTMKRKLCTFSDCYYTEPMTRQEIRTVTPFLSAGPMTPWMDKETVEYMESLLTKQTVILEFGAGYSTIWFAGRTEYVYSVEESPLWYECVIGWLAARNLYNVSVIRPEEIIPDDTMDFILIDGGNRLANTKKALEFVSKDGIIVIDDQEEYIYKRAGEYLESQGWSCIKTIGEQITKFYRRSEKNA